MEAMTFHSFAANNLASWADHTTTYSEFKKEMWGNDYWH
jgi:hypothetical protein